MNKKRVGVYLFLLTLVSSILSFTIVSAAETSSGGATQLPKIMGDAWNNFLQPFLGSVLGTVPSGEWFFAKILFFMIIFAVVYISLEQVSLLKNNTWALILIVIAASILATRWISDIALVKTIILPYSVVGIAISAGLPFVLWFLIIDVGLKGSEHKTVRKIAWGFFAVVFLGLYATRSGELGDYAWIYPGAALMALIMVLFDGSAQKALLAMQIDKADMQTKRMQVEEIKDQMEKQTKRFTRDNDTYASIFDDAQKGRKGYHHDMAEFRKQIATLK